ncbi:MAG: chalcone isomerase family protein, partial [Pseudomonadota bacterium]
MRQTISALVLMLSLVSFTSFAHAQSAAMTLEGVDIAESQVVGSTKLVLNGAAIQKRAFFKTNTVAIYLPEKRDSLEAILKQT